MKKKRRCLYRIFFWHFSFIYKELRKYDYTWRYIWKNLRKNQKTKLKTLKCNFKPTSFPWTGIFYISRFQSDLEFLNDISTLYTVYSGFGMWGTWSCTNFHFFHTTCNLPIKTLCKLIANYKYLSCFQVPDRIWSWEGTYFEKWRWLTTPSSLHRTWKLKCQREEIKKLSIKYIWTRSSTCGSSRILNMYCAYEHYAKYKRASFFWFVQRIRTNYVGLRKITLHIIF